MNFAFSEEQDELRRSVRKFLEDKSPISEVRKQMESQSGFDPEVWTQATQQLGLAGISIPEEYGGLGFTNIELGIVLEEMGRALFCAPYFSSVVLGANALLASGDKEAMAAHLPGIASGDSRYTVAMYESAAGFDISGTATTAVPSGGVFRISARKDYVIDGATATDFLVFAKAGDGLSLFHVKRSDSTRSTWHETMDQTRKLASVEFEAAEGSLVGTLGQGAETYKQLIDIACAALSAEMVGGAQSCLDMSVEYAKVRIQFGRPIGSFQAIKHKCADMLVEVESAKSAAYYAMWAAANDAAELNIAAPLAKSFCSDAYFMVAAENIQIHGGIGFTWEHDAHLYFKRAKSSQLMFGSPSNFREELAQRIGL